MRDQAAVEVEVQDHRLERDDAARVLELVELDGVADLTLGERDVRPAGVLHLDADLGHAARLPPSRRSSASSAANSTARPPTKTNASALEVSMSSHARAVPSRISASPISWLSSVIRIALQRPSSPIISAVTPGSANHPPSVCAVSGVSSHGQCSIIVDGREQQDERDQRLHRADDEQRGPHVARQRRLARLGRARVGRAVAPPRQRHEHGRRHVEADPDPERDVVGVEAIEMREGRDRHEQRERGDRQEADLDAVPAASRSATRRKKYAPAM